MFYQVKRTVSEMRAALPSGATYVCRPANNTIEHRNAAGARVIRLHNTDILTFPPRGGFAINTGGFNTRTTRDRLNAFLPAGYRVHTEKGILHLSSPGARPVVPFLETIVVGPRGGVTADCDPRAVRKLVDSYMREWKRRGLPAAEESGGDPWVFSPDQVTPDVMRDWCRGGYVHRRLFVLAHESAGVTPAGVGYYLHQVDHAGGTLDNFHIQRIRRYVRRTLGLG